MSFPNKIALVTPWFFSGNGGAEVFCAGLARALAGIGRDVEVWTTCCKDPFCDWGANQLPAGVQDLRGIRIRRFPVRPRSADLFAQHYRAMDHGITLSPEQEEELLRNSINSDTLVEAVARSAGEYLFFFLPYMYGTTYYGMRAAPEQHRFLIPCLHNEPFAYIGEMQKLFRRAAGCVFLSEPERNFASALYPLADTPQLIMGAGVDAACTGEAGRFREARKLTAPFLLFVGRKVPGKGADHLVEFFAQYMKANPQSLLHLVLMGGGELDISKHSRERVHSLLPADSQEIYDAMAACEFLVHPSFFESFSLVIMEAWLNRKAVLVNGECEVTQYHALRSNGGLYYTNYPEFSEAVALLEHNAVLRMQLGRAGKAYVLQNYNWYDVAVRLQNFLAQRALAAA